MNFIRLMATGALLAATSVATKADDQVAFGEYLSGSCVTCHSAKGKDDGIPSIVGWDKEAFVEVLLSYKNKERDNKAMQGITAALSKEEMQALAAYFATLKEQE